jgi:hypothetical protein
MTIDDGKRVATETSRGEYVEGLERDAAAGSER